MKKMVSFFLVIWLSAANTAVAQAKELNLHAKAAVLMEADSGRVMYGKSERLNLSNASTTKIMTCLYVLEHCNLEETAKVSANAANQPRVRLGVRKGESYRVRDLLYGLMLESYNDCAVVLAEHAEGSVRAFAKKMNLEAKKLGAQKTHFVSPNGLDASDESGKHETTAYDLARIMRKCIQNSKFLEITGTRQYKFQDVSGKRSFSCVNHNTLLSSMKGAISGKTGYTAKAGYCYVGALKAGGIKMIAVVLGSGWPPNKNYKWSDVHTLVDYGVKNFEYREIIPNIRKIRKIPVEEGRKKETALKISERKVTLFLKKNEKVEIQCRLPQRIAAPVGKGEEIGQIRYVVQGKCKKSTAVVAADSVEKAGFWWYFGKLLEKTLLGQTGKSSCLYFFSLM